MEALLFGIFIVLLVTGVIPAIFGWLVSEFQENTAFCPHNVRGGITKGKCQRCVRQAEEENRQRELQRELQYQKTKAEEERKANIISQANALKKKEVERLKGVQLQKESYIRALTSQQFENVVADIFYRLGYTVKQTPYSNDGGRDAILTKNGKTYLVECKLYSPDNTIGRRDLQIFFAAMQGDKAEKGFYVNTGRFASTAVKYAEANNIELMDMDKLLDMMKQVFPNTNMNESLTIKSMCLECGDIVLFSLEKNETEKSCRNRHMVKNNVAQNNLKKLVVHQEYCNKCGKEMRLIDGRNGKFWGCMGYPNCKNTKPYAK